MVRWGVGVVGLHVLQACALAHAPTVRLADGVAQVNLVATSPDSANYVIDPAEKADPVREVAFKVDGVDVDASPGRAIVLLDEKQWQQCSWPASEPSAAAQCPASGLVRLDGSVLRLDASMLARASLANGTLFAAVELSESRRPRQNLCAQWKFRLVLCQSAVAASGRPTECEGALLSGSCDTYTRGSSKIGMCSTVRAQRPYFQTIPSLVLLLLVLWAMRQVQQDYSSCTESRDDQAVAAAQSTVRTSMRLALHPRTLSIDELHDTAENLKPLIDTGFKQHAADMLLVHGALCVACIGNVAVSHYQDDYGSIMHYIAEGLQQFGKILSVVLCLLMLICRRPDAFERRALLTKWRNVAMLYATVLYLIRIIFKYEAEGVYHSDGHVQSMYADGNQVLFVMGAVPVFLVLMGILMWAASKTFQRARTTALQGVENIAAAADRLSTNLLTNSRDEEIAGQEAEEDPEATQAGGNVLPDAGVSESVNNSEWIQKSASRDLRWLVVGVVAVVARCLAAGVRWLLGHTLQDYGCTGCRCKFGIQTPAEYELYKYAGSDAADAQCTSYLGPSEPLTRWQKVESSSASNSADVLEQVKIVETLFDQLIVATVFAYIYIEHNREVGRRALFVEREAAGASAMKSGDGAEAERQYQRCCEVLSGPAESSFVTRLLANSRILRDEKARGDDQSRSGNHEEAVMAYRRALDAAPQCVTVEQLLAQASDKLERKQHLDATQRREKETILNAAPADMGLPKWIVMQGQPTVGAAQTLLGRLQAALNAKNLGWVIRSCSAVNMEDGVSSDAVVLCHDRKLGTLFTAKAIFAPNCWPQDREDTTWTSFDADTQRHLQQQADILRSLSHDRVARLVEGIFLAFDTIFFCKFDLLEGETLSEIFTREQGCMLEHEAVKLGVDVLSGLDAIHKRKMVHACVTPECIVQVSGIWKLQTWSVLRVPSHGTGLSLEQQRMCHYLAPEQVARVHSSSNDNGDDPRSDLYSVGAVLYRALAGNLPIAAGETDMMKIINAVRYKPAQDLRDVTQARAVNDCVAVIVSQALQKDFFDRHESAESMQTALSDALLQSPGARYDIFVSYRVKSEKEFANALHKELSRKTIGLNGERARVYLDSAELRDGKRWDDGFVAGLMRSAVFVPLVSAGSAEPISRLESDEAQHVDNVLLEWSLALRLEELGVVQSILPVLVGKASENGDGTRPGSFFSQEDEWGGRDSYLDVAHPPTAEKEQHYIESWENQIVTQVAARNAGILPHSEIVELAKQLGGALTTEQVRSTFGGDTAIDAATFLQWWRGDENKPNAASRSPPKTIRQIVNGIKTFQGVDCHSLRRNDADGRGELLGGDALVQEVARRVLQVASETVHSSMNETLASPSSALSPSSARSSDAAALTALPDHVLEEELRRRKNGM